MAVTEIRASDSELPTWRSPRLIQHSAREETLDQPVEVPLKTFFAILAGGFLGLALLALG